jgi:hypothetical protein
MGYPRPLHASRVIHVSYAVKSNARKSSANDFADGAGLAAQIVTYVLPSKGRIETV